MTMIEFVLCFMLLIAVLWVAMDLILFIGGLICVLVMATCYAFVILVRLLKFVWETA